MRRGKFIVFEGPDGSGKSTLANLYCASLRSGGQPAAHVGFPSHEGAIGAFIRSSFEGHVRFDPRAYVHLMLADALDWEPLVERTLASGSFFVADRHATFSSFVYQAEVLPEEAIARTFAALPWHKPDMVFFLDAPAAVVLERMRTRTKYKDVVFEREDVAHNERRRERYLSLADRYDGPCTVLDATRPAEDLLAEALRATLP
jgi:dTMP kinase